MTKSILDNILEWSKKQPLWQQDALRRLFTVDALAPSDFEELAEICKARHGLSLASANQLSSAHLPVSDSSAMNAVSLVSLTHHGGVNALALEQTVSFGPKLTVVYGENAAGKSGYTRVLKAACRSRAVEDILGNVLGTGAPLKAAATTRITDGSGQMDIPWDAGGPPSSLLAQISVFDSHCVPVYLRDKNDVAFRPFGLDLFDKLAVACLEVKKRLELASQQLAVSLLPPTPTIIAGTKARQLLDSLTGLTKKSDVLALSTLSDVEKGRLKHLTELKRDFEAADPKKRAQELSSRAGRFEMLANHLKALGDALGAATLGELGDARKNLKSVRQALAALRDSAITPDLLPDTGGGTWRSLWDAALAFAKIASPEVTFNHAEGARCPFCQQEIHSDAASRLQHLAEFVRSTAQQETDSAFADYSTRRKAIVSIQIERSEMLAVVAEVVADDTTFEARVAQYFKTAATIQQGVATLTDDGDDDLLVITFEASVEVDLRALASALRARATTLQASATALSAQEQTELTELNSRVALQPILDSIIAEIERKRKVAALGLCVADTTTGPLTKKSTELTKLLITDQLRQTFQEELKKIGFTHLSVEIQSAGGSKGALFHKLVFSNAPGVKVTDVLSEGESRALSLAAFLTELSTAPTRSGIIFDDPVSSLDHRWREKIGRRLVAEAVDRQVIVFTHDLLFLKSLISDSDTSGVPCHHQYVRREGAAGICSADLPWVAMKVKERIGVLNNRWQAANKLAAKGDLEAYESAAREIFGLLRETWERAISEILLNDVVERYRPSIETKRVALLHDIIKADCKAVDAGMTAASRWILGHDEALADGTPFPHPAEVKQHIDSLDVWAKTIRKRREGKKSA